MSGIEFQFNLSELNLRSSRSAELPRILCGTVRRTGKAHVASDRQDGSEERRPRRSSTAGGPHRGPRDQRGKPPQSSSPDRARRTQPRPQDGGDASERSGPPLPASIEARQLAPDMRGELITLDKATADYVARHLVAAGELLEEDPEAALEHAKAARNRPAGSPPSVRRSESRRIAAATGRKPSPNARGPPDGQ